VDGNADMLRRVGRPAPQAFDQLVIHDRDDSRRRLDSVREGVTIMARSVCADRPSLPSDLRERFARAVVGVIECVVERLRSSATGAVPRPARCRRRPSPHLIDVIQPRLARVSSESVCSSLLVFRDRSVRCYGSIDGSARFAGRWTPPALGAFRRDVV